MPRSFVLPLVFAVPAAIAVWVAADLAGVGPTFGSGDRAGLAAFVAVALIAEMMAVDFRLGGDQQQPHASMAFLPFLGMIAVFSPPIAIVAVASVVGFSQIVVRRNEMPRSIYNIAQAAITAGLAGLVFHLLPTPTKPHVVAAFVMSAGAFFTANIVIAGAVISYLKSASPKSVIGHLAGGIKYDFLASPIAFFPVALYDSASWSIIVIVLPILLFHYFHLSKQQLLDAHTDVIRVLIKAIETRDPYTSGHSMRVSTMAQLIATDMGLPRPLVRTVYTAALLHDIGKIDSAFSDVLQKPYELTAEERALIETHPEKGATMLQGLRSVDPVVINAVLHHHERFDGGGYPQGLRGTDIPIPARIIMLCDSVDAMLSDRPYRKALSMEQVYAELVRCAGTQFDPDIVDVIFAQGTLEKAAKELSGEFIRRDDSPLELSSSSFMIDRSA